MDDTTASSNTQTDDNPPELPPDSPGSSVSSCLQEEYDDLLKYAVVIPSYDPDTRPGTLRDVKGSFLEDERPRQPPNPTAPERVRFADQVTGATSVASNSQEHAIDDDESSCHDDDTPRPCLVTMKTVAMDTDYPRMDTILDDWSFELKKRVMAELSRLKSNMTEELHKQISAERTSNMNEMRKLHDDVTQLRHLVQTYETSIQRKDDVITNLTRTLEHEKKKREQQISFSEWKVQTGDRKREEFCMLLARQQYNRVLTRRVYNSWRSLITDRWRQRVEKACQARATEVCVNVTNEYEARIAKLEEELEYSREEARRLGEERDSYEETMKKAFMRGVCALNVEAMNMFQESERREFRETLAGVTGLAGMTGMAGVAGMAGMTGMAGRTGRSSPDRQMASPKIVTAASAGVAAPQTKTVHFAPFMKPAPSSGKTTKHARDQKASRAGHVTVNPPMSSVVVERHPPVTKQTISHAVAAQYPRDPEDVLPTNQKPVKQTNQKPATTSTNQQRSIYKRIAGQSDCTKTISHVTSVQVGES